MHYYHFSHKSSKAIRDLGKKILVVTVVKLYFAEVVTVTALYVYVVSFGALENLGSHLSTML